MRGVVCVLGLVVLVGCAHGTPVSAPNRATPLQHAIEHDLLEEQLSLPQIQELLQLATPQDQLLDLEAFGRRFGPYERTVMTNLFTYAADAFGAEDYNNFMSDDGGSWNDYQLGLDEWRNLYEILARLPPVKDIAMAMSQFSLVAGATTSLPPDQYKQQFFSVFDRLTQDERLKTIKDRASKFIDNLNYEKARNDGGTQEQLTACHYVRESLFQKRIVTDRTLREANALWETANPPEGAMQAGLGVCMALHEGEHPPLPTAKLLHPKKHADSALADASCASLCAAPKKFCGGSIHPSIYEAIATAFLLDDSAATLDLCAFQIAYAGLRQIPIPQLAKCASSDSGCTTPPFWCNNDQVCAAGTHCCAPGNGEDQMCCPDDASQAGAPAYVIANMPAADAHLEGTYTLVDSVYRNSKGCELKHESPQLADDPRVFTKWILLCPPHETTYSATVPGHKVAVVTNTEIWKRDGDNSQARFVIRKTSTSTTARVRPEPTALEAFQAHHKAWFDTVFYAYARCDERKNSACLDLIGLSFSNLGNALQLTWVSRYVFDPNSRLFDVAQEVPFDRDDVMVGSLRYAEQLFNAILKSNNPHHRYTKIPFKDPVTQQDIRITRDHIYHYLLKLHETAGLGHGSMLHSTTAQEAISVAHQFGSLEDSVMDTVADSLTWNDFVRGLTHYGKLFPSMSQADVLSALKKMEWTTSSRVPTSEFLVFQSCMSQFAELVTTEDGSFDPTTLDAYLQGQKRDVSIVSQSAAQGRPSECPTDKKFGQLGTSDFFPTAATTAWGHVVRDGDAFAWEDVTGIDEIQLSSQYHRVRSIYYTCARDAPAKLNPAYFTDSTIEACKEDSIVVAEPGKFGCAAGQAKFEQAGCVMCATSLDFTLELTSTTKIPHKRPNKPTDLTALRDLLARLSRVTKTKIEVKAEKWLVVSDHVAQLAVRVEPTEYSVFPVVALQTLATTSPELTPPLINQDVTVGKIAFKISRIVVGPSTGVGTKKSVCECACNRHGQKYSAALGTCTQVLTEHTSCRVDDFVEMCAKSLFSKKAGRSVPRVHTCNPCASCTPKTCQVLTGCTGGQCQYHKKPGCSDLEMELSSSFEEDMCSGVWQDSQGVTRDLLGRELAADSECWNRAISSVEHRWHKHTNKQR